MPTPLSKKLKWAGVESQSGPTEPVWKGPETDGVTFSLLSRFLVCRERFRLLVVKGLQPQDQFNHRVEYGNMWHTCEEALAASYPWERALVTYCRNLSKRYPTSQEQIEKWYHVCTMQFPLYVRYWQDHPDVLERTPLLQEHRFAVPYTLPSGRKVVLRGKWDSVDIVGKKKAAGVYLQENKTKGDINEQQIKRQLSFDLQTMLYLVALHEPVPGSIHNTTSTPILGVRYNVVRRPLSGGKGNIVQGKGTAGAKCSKCKGTGKDSRYLHECVKCGGAGRVGGTPPETKEEYYRRLAEYIEEEPDLYFMRWRVEVGPHDIVRFRRECLDPILEQLCYWWDWVCDPVEQAKREKGAYSPFSCIHWRHPFGVYNVLDEGGSSDLDEYLESGSEVGLARVSNLFPELL